jgi:asparagine synthetase B (glutamine-hydrolysing)
MPDFIYTSDPTQVSRFADVYARYFDPEAGGPAFQVTGDWGAVLACGDRYEGFQPYEDSTYLMIVFGGPLLNLEAGGDTSGPSDLTRALLAASREDACFDWHTRVAGPCAAMIVYKETGVVRVITDSLGILPVFRAGRSGACVFGTKLTPVAHLSTGAACIDEVGACDFIMNGKVTFPHTLYHGVERLAPGLDCTRDPSGEWRERIYWRPLEAKSYAGIDEAARDLRGRMIENVSRIVAGRRRIAGFLSGGEDSRALLAMLPPGLEVQCFTIADFHNREARTAQRAAALAGHPWSLVRRAPDHYIKNFDYACRVMGSETSLDQLHFLGLPKALGLPEYEAVLDGMGADYLLKCHTVSLAERKIRGYRVWPSRAMAITDKGVYPRVEAHLAALATVLAPELAEAIARRCWRHVELVRTFRPHSVAEWWQMWPASQSGEACQHVLVTRCFRAFEPFMMNNIVDIGCAVPLAWKVNRRLYHRAFHKLVGRLGWIPHADGWFPALGVWGNIAAALPVGGYRMVENVFRKRETGGNYSWPVWSDITGRPLFAALVEEHRRELSSLAGCFQSRDEASLLGDGLTATQKMRLLQTLFHLRDARS